MKSIIYFLLVNFFLLTQGSGSSEFQSGTRTIYIKPVTSVSGTDAVGKSAVIISERLKVYGINNAVVSPLPDMNQIKIEVPENITTAEIEGLLTLKGDLAFYETFNRKELHDLLNNDNKLFGLVNSDPGISPTEVRIGCIDIDKTGNVNGFIKNMKKQDSFRLSWGFNGFSSNEKLRCLYALKQSPILNRSDIELIKSEKAKDGESYNIMITFKKNAVQKWADVTSKNINHAIAITMDNYVYSAPVVKDSITGGACEISGNNTEKEANYILALVNNERLPYSFEIVK